MRTTEGEGSLYNHPTLPTCYPPANYYLLTTYLLATYYILTAYLLPAGGGLAVQARLKCAERLQRLREEKHL